MGKPALALELASESALLARAGELARRWRESGHMPLLIGLTGGLGAGKTSFVRGLLRGLGYQDRVPSPTYTLLEQYDLEGLTIVHMDLYRLASAEEFEHLGVRDWLAEPQVWLLVEWPERAPQLMQRADLVIELEIVGETARRLVFSARTRRAQPLLELISELDSNKPS